MAVKGFYINLDRDTERRANAEAQLARVGWSDRFERFAAVLGADAPQRPDVGNRAEVGCFLSHLEILRRSAGSQDWVHVIEDDVVISRYAEALLNTLFALPGIDACDILFTNVLVPQESWAMRRFMELFEACTVTDEEGAVAAVTSVVAEPLQRYDFLLTTSYLVNPRAVERVTRLLDRRLEQPDFKPIDFTYQRLARAGELQMMCVLPFATAPRLAGDTTIRDGVSPWRVAHLISEMALFADRDVRQLKQVLKTLEATATGGVTRDLIAEAYRYAIGVPPEVAVTF